MVTNHALINFSQKYCCRKDQTFKSGRDSGRDWPEFFINRQHISVWCPWVAPASLGVSGAVVGLAILAFNFFFQIFYKELYVKFGISNITYKNGIISISCYEL